LDEKELELFLKNKICFSRDEKKYLVKYVVKGIPDHMRGKVIYQNFKNISINSFG